MSVFVYWCLSSSQNEADIMEAVEEVGVAQTVDDSVRSVAQLCSGTEVCSVMQFK